MVFGYFTLTVALLISAIAAYYSIVGLANLFAAAVIPVIIMGAALEVGKITAALWLKLNWYRSPLTFKIYLIPAVVILMFLTSMGIFGFLSKAHLDQASSSLESQAQIQRLETEITRRTDIVKKAESKIKELESTGTGQDAQIQSQIDREQARIDASLKRIEPAIKEQNDIIVGQNKIYQDQLQKIDQDLQRLQTNLERNEIAATQSQVGVQPDGRIGPRTQAAIKEYQDRLNAKKTELITQIERSNNTPAIQTARREIQRIRTTVDAQINESNQLINRLRLQVAKGPSTNIDSLIDEQQTKIRTANTELEQFIEQKYKLETEYRKQEAEVGPVKYIAELIYGNDPDKSLLEQAVRIVIIIIVAVFDPLALVLILAAQQSLKWAEENNKNKAINIDVNTDPIPAPPTDIDNTYKVYLDKPWVPIPGGPPIVANPHVKDPEYCELCNSKLVDAKELGLICENVSCISYKVLLQEDDFISNKLPVSTSLVTTDRLLSMEDNEIKQVKTDQLLIVNPKETNSEINNDVSQIENIEEKLLDNTNKTQTQVEAKRSYKAVSAHIPETEAAFKATMITVPETLNIRKKLEPVADNVVNKDNDIPNTKSNDKT